MTTSPNFLYIGTSKAGSTWIFKVLAWHPQIYITPSKGLYFFCNHFHHGWDWYRDQFHPEPQHKIIGEISHSYLFSADACQRIHDSLAGVKLMACLREPVERTFSDYLDGIKNGKLHGTLEEELERTPSLINRSRYATHLSRYLELFDRQQIHIASFDELRAAPRPFVAKIFDFLNVEQLEIPTNLQRKVLPAGTPRIRPLAMLAKRLSKIAKRVGLAGLRGRVKTSTTVRNLLYRPYTSESRPVMPATIKARLRDMMAEEVQRLDAIAGTDFCRQWGYANELTAKDAMIAKDFANFAALRSSFGA